MRLTGWRTILPLVQLAAYIPLVWYGCWYRPTWQYWFRTWTSPSSTSNGWYPTWIDGIESFPEQLAAGLNFPAAAIAALSVAPFDDQLRSGASRELAMHVVTAIYIPLLWYVVGKGLDGRGKRKSVTLSNARKAAAVAGLAALLIVAILMTWSLLEGQRYTMVGLSLAWVGCGILALWFRLRERGSDFQTH